jgi:hypothetical protein
MRGVSAPPARRLAREPPANPHTGGGFCGSTTSQQQENPLGESFADVRWCAWVCANV